MDHVDPPDLALRPTLRRLLPLWWEQRRLVGLGLACALAFTALSITIPILIKRVVDEAIVGSRERPPAPVPRPDRRARGAPLRRQLHAPVRDRADRDRRRGAAARDALPRVPDLSARVLRPARDRRGDLARHERRLSRPLLHRLGRRPGDPERDDDRRRRDRARQRQRASSRSTRRWRCRRSRSSPGSSRTGSSRSRGSYRRARATSPRRRTRRSSGSRWCRRSVARTTCARASSAGPRRCGTRRCGPPRSRRTSCPACSSSPRSGSPPSSSSAAAR